MAVEHFRTVAVEHDIVLSDCCSAEHASSAPYIEFKTSFLASQKFLETLVLRRGEDNEKMCSGSRRLSRARYLFCK